MTLEAHFEVAFGREPMSADEPPTEAAEEAPAMTPVEDGLGDFWQDILDGRAVFYCDGAGPRGRYVVCRVLESARLGATLTRLETAVLVRVLGGEQQKAIAAELGIACSTASKWYTQAGEKLALEGGTVPLPLVIAAQSWAAGKTPPVAARRATIFHEGSQFVVLTVPTPNLASERLLTRAEREVAVALIEGQSRGAIAIRRSTSQQTVACQLRGIFSKLDIRGRCALIKHGLDAGWFR
jgi:DNA-binding NarL/FixJ family response regulator